MGGERRCASRRDDDWHRAASARAWWVLTAAGIPDVRILDGGLSAWTGSLETGTVTAAPPGDVTVAHDNLYAGARPTLTAEQAAVASTLLDARAPERFRGDVEPVDPVAGHIPGAVNVPTTANLDSDGRVRAATDLSATYAQVGAVAGADVAVYCGSGVTAAHDVLALELAGVRAKLYPGSWSAWITDSARPIARG